jgi:hypothetical protein
MEVGKKGATARVGGGDGGSAIADGMELAGVAQRGATVHGFQLAGMGRKRRERRPRPCHFHGWGRSHAAPSMTGSGRTSPAWVIRALEATIRETKGMGR